MLRVLYRRLGERSGTEVGVGVGVGVAAAPSRGIDMPKSRKEKPAVPPLTSSVQENFRGFTYHGESIVAPPAGMLAQKDAQEEAVDEAESPYPTTDDEVEDDAPAGRYAKAKGRGGEFDGFDDDMHL